MAKTCLISGIKISTVVPSNVVGEDKDRELTNLDLAMKFHYIKGVHFFTRGSVEGLTIYDLKRPMFDLLNYFRIASGRIRRSRSDDDDHDQAAQSDGRPFIKCNDGGVRIVEADCTEKSVEEWLGMKDSELDFASLVYNHALGPDLGFSPLVFIQFTTFSCGGLSVGLSWAHILGDVFTASAFMNMWGQLLTGHHREHTDPEWPRPLHVPDHDIHELNLPPPPSPILREEEEKPISVIKRVDPTDPKLWKITNSCKMGTHSFNFTAKQLDQLVFDLKLSPSRSFEALSARIWKSISETRGDSGPKAVTICTRSVQQSKEVLHESPRNGVVLSRVEAEFPIAKAGEGDLAELIAEKKVEENGMIEDMVDLKDSIVYGANLTFVNLEEASIYGLELNGKSKPVFAEYVVDGVGDEGVVFVLPAPPSAGGSESGGDGRTVTVVLQEPQLEHLKNELREKWGVI